MSTKEIVTGLKDPTIEEVRKDFERDKKVRIVYQDIIDGVLEKRTEVLTVDDFCEDGYIEIPSAFYFDTPIEGSTTVISKERFIELLALKKVTQMLVPNGYDEQRIQQVFHRR